MKYSDWTIFFISLGMSIIGTIIRGVNFGNTLVNQLAGLFIGTYDDLFGVETSCFPLMNWFIIVVINYMFAKKLRHCANPDRFFGVALPISGVIVGVYMAYAIPNRLGMMSDDLTNYYLLTTPNVLILFPAMIFAISLYHFATKLISEKLKAGIIKISNSLTPIYYAQWIIILGIICTAATILNFKDIGTGTVVIIAVLVSVVSIMLGVRCPKKIKKIIS